MKAYQIWMVARDAATLQELARALLDERDDRLECEAYNEALTVADKINLARSHFGRAVHARRPMYAVLTLPAPEVFAPINCQLQRLGDPAVLTITVDGGEIKREVELSHIVRPVLTPEGRAHMAAIGRANQLCNCDVPLGPGGGRCVSCGRAKR